MTVQGLNREDSLDSGLPSEYSPEEDTAYGHHPAKHITDRPDLVTNEKHARLKALRYSSFGSEKHVPSPPVQGTTKVTGNSSLGKSTMDNTDIPPRKILQKRQASLKACQAIKKQAKESLSDGGSLDAEDTPATKVDERGKHINGMVRKEEEKRKTDKNLQAVIDAHRSSLGNVLPSPEPLNAMNHATRVKENMTPDHVAVPNRIRGAPRARSRLAGVDATKPEVPPLPREDPEVFPKPPKAPVHHTHTTTQIHPDIDDDDKDEDDEDLNMLDSFHHAIQKAMDSQTALSERISQQKMELLKMEMGRALERAYAASKLKCSKVAQTSHAENTTAIQSLHCKLEEMSEYFTQQQQNLRAMKKRCEELQENALSILESSQDKIDSVHQAEMESLSSLHQNVQERFSRGIQDIQQSCRFRSRPHGR